MCDGKVTKSFSGTPKPNFRIQYPYMCVSCIVCMLYPIAILSHSAATAERIRVPSRPSARPQPRPPPAPTECAKGVRLRRRLEETGGRMRLGVGDERRLIKVDRATNARHAKCKSAK